MKKWTALLLALAMTAALVPWAGAEAESALVCAVEDLRGETNPFFAESAGDRLVAELTNGALLTTERGGSIVCSGIEGETLPFDGTDYDYRGLGDVEVVRNDDGSAEYRIALREDALFSDGHPVDIDDVIFSLYVLADADYDGPSKLAALPIEGMDAYRGGFARLDDLLLSAGRDNADFTAWDTATQAAFWADIDAAGEALCQEIVSYCLDTYLDAHADVIGSTREAILSDPQLQVRFAMEMWGYGDYAFDGATTADFWAALLDAYDGDVRAAETTERVSAPLSSFIDDYEAKYGTRIATGSSAENISGVMRTGDHSLTLRMTEYDPAALYELALCIAPLHVYGDEALYDYENNSFGFTRGDLSAVRARQGGVGCGPYVLDGAEGSNIALRANENYFAGAPAIEGMRIAGCGAGEALNLLLRGEADLAVAPLDEAAAEAITAANADEGLSGEVLETLLTYAPEYQYLGVNAALVNVDGDAGSEASRALRRALLTVLAANREEMVAQNLGDGAFVIEYPVSAASWAAPSSTDDAYAPCYCLNADGAPIYADAMGDIQRHEAALNAAVELLKRAGYTWSEAEGRFTGAPAGAAMEYACAIAENHPARSMLDAAAEQLATIGIRLSARELTQEELEAALEVGGAQLWIAGRSDGSEPDLRSRYHSAGSVSENNCQIADDALDAHIADYLSATDREARRASCKAALEVVLDWGCELPLYQGYLGVVTNAQTVDGDTLPEDMTPAYGWWAEIENLRLR